ncbi:MAG: hypothetical protein ABJB10_19215 [Mesorhizobium sp.]
MKQDLDTSLLFPSVIGRAHLALDKDGSPLSAERFKRGPQKNAPGSLRASSAGPADQNQSAMAAASPVPVGTFVRLTILDV